MSDHSGLLEAEGLHMREPESAEGGIGNCAWKAEPRLEPKVIIIGAGQCLELKSI